MTPPDRRTERYRLGLRGVLDRDTSLVFGAAVPAAGLGLHHLRIAGATSWYPMKEGAMQPAYTAVVKHDGEWWIGWIEEVPGVNCQERTREELVESLRFSLGEAIEFNRAEAS